MVDFLVQFRLVHLVLDIAVFQCDSNAFIKAYSVGVSVWYQRFYLVCNL